MYAFLANIMMLLDSAAAKLIGESNEYMGVFRHRARWKSLGGSGTKERFTGRGWFIHR